MRLPKIRTGPPVIKPSQVVPSESVPKKTTQIDYLKKQRDEARLQRNFLWRIHKEMTVVIQQKKTQQEAERKENNCLWEKVRKMGAVIQQLRQENRAELLKECALNGSLSPAENVSSTPETETEMSEGSLSLSNTSNSEGS